MRWGLGLLVSALVWGWVETAHASRRPGDDRWPQIPDPGGMAFFLGEWYPSCNDGSWISSDSYAHGAITFHPGGRISYFNPAPYFPTRYRLIEETPFYVTLLVQYPEGERRLEYWLLRSWEKGLESIGAFKCGRYGLHEANFNFDFDHASDEQVRQHWESSTACHPDRMSRTLQDFDYLEHWSTVCNFHRKGPGDVYWERWKKDHQRRR